MFRYRYIALSSWCCWEDELRGGMGIVPAGDEMTAYALKDDKGHDKPDDEKYARIDDYAQKAAIVFWRMAVGGGIVRFAHTK